jgi:hypothetical protein
MSVCRLAAGDDRLQKHLPLIFDERHEIHILLSPDDEDPLAAVPLRVGMLDDVEHIAAAHIGRVTSSRKVTGRPPDAGTRPDRRARCRSRVSC